MSYYKGESEVRRGWEKRWVVTQNKVIILDKQQLFWETKKGVLKKRNNKLIEPRELLERDFAQ